MDKDKIDLKLTEDQTVLILIEHLKLKGWDIESYCLGQQRGYDIVASKYEQKLFVEVKGAKGNDNSPTKKENILIRGKLKIILGKPLLNPLKQSILIQMQKLQLRTQMILIFEE